MIILAVGDVVGEPGLQALRRGLYRLKRDEGVDFCVVNGENSAKNNGLTPDTLDCILSSGADVVTTGNHVFRHREIYDVLGDGYTPVIRPANLGQNAPGSGIFLTTKGSVKIAVMNLMGSVGLDVAVNPFDCADSLVAAADAEGCSVKLVDFHAEATSEKRSLGFYLDGRVSAVFGTHTHVQTSDACVLPKSTGYITDLGMTGPEISVLGVEPQCSITLLKERMPARFTVAEGPCVVEGCLFDIDEATGLCRDARSVRLR